MHVFTSRTDESSCEHVLYFREKAIISIIKLQFSIHNQLDKVFKCSEF